MFWFVSVLLICVTIVVVLYPLWKGKGTGEELNTADAEVYKRQLDELERDVAAGLVPEDEAEATRSEIGHRLLAADKVAKVVESRGLRTLSPGQRKIYALLAIIAIPALALGLYQRSGMPGYSDMPYETRCADMSSESHANMDMSFMTDCLAKEMAKTPTADGLAMLARSYVSMGQYMEASKNYAKALELAGPRVDYLEGLGMAEVSATQGFVTLAAYSAFSKAVEIDPIKALFSRYYVAQYAYQNGDPIAALRDWTDILESISPDHQYYAEIDQRIQMVIAETQAAEAGGGAQGPVNPHGQGDPHASIAQTAPVEEDEAALQGLDEDQKAMVQGMVSRLAGRLQDNPQDLDGWLKLARSYSILGEHDMAKDALATATLTFMGDADAINQIVDMSNELGLADGPKLDEDAKD